MPKFVQLGTDLPLRAWLPHTFSGYTSARLTITRVGADRATLERDVALVDGEVAAGEDKPAKARLAATTWKPTDCLADHEMGATFNVHWSASGTVLSSSAPVQQVFVYRGSVAIEAVRKERDGRLGPAGRAAFRCEFRPAPDWVDAAPVLAPAYTTNDEGKATVMGLVPGDLLITWRSPNILAEEGWANTDGYHELGARRKATLGATHRAVFVSPKVEDGERVQWVNLAPAGDAPDNGAVLVVKARVDPRDGKGAQGDSIFLKVQWDPANSHRTRPSPTVDGTSVVKLRKQQGLPHVVVEKKLAADDTEVAFELDLGGCGRDKYSLWVGGTRACEDAGPLVVKTMRKVNLDLYFPPEYPDAAALVNDDLKKTINTALEVAGIELVFSAPKTPTYDQAYKESIPRKVTAEVAAKLGWTNRVHFVYTHPALLQSLLGFCVPAAAPTVRMFFADQIYEFSARPQPFDVAAFRKPESEWTSAGDGATGFMPFDLDGNTILGDFAPAKPRVDTTRKVYLWDEETRDFVNFAENGARRGQPTWCWEVVDEAVVMKGKDPARMVRWVAQGAARAGKRTIANVDGKPAGTEERGLFYCETEVVSSVAGTDAVPSAWTDAAGRTGLIEPKHLEIDAAPATKNLRFRLKIPEANASGDNPVTAKVGLRTVTQRLAGTSSGCGAVLFVKGLSADELAYGILHEVGHALGHALLSKPAPGIPLNGPSSVAPDERVVYTYGAAAGTVNQRGHTGQHCAYKLDPEHLKSTTNYSTLLGEKGLHGTCIMFGGVGPKTVYSAESRQFCPSCVEHARAQILTTVDGSYH